MATIVSDSFNRADSSTLGIADTGQTWVQPSGNWGINSNTARSISPDTFGSAFAVIEAGGTDCLVQAVMVNPSVWSNYVPLTSLIFRYVSSAYYYELSLQKTGTAGGPVYRLNLNQIYAGSSRFLRGADVSSVIADGSTIAVSACGNTYNAYVDGVLQFTKTDTLEPTPTNYGTQCGIYAYAGTVPLFGGNYQKVDDFLVTTVSGCPTSVSYNCVTNTCVDPGNGNGTYGTLQSCLDNCVVPATYNCTNGQCIDPGDGTGTYATLQLCLDSGCGPSVLTANFDQGTGNFYYLVAPVVDSGDELRSKVVKAGRVTSKRTHQSVQFYAYDVEDGINVSDLELGVNSTTGALSLDDSTNVSQSPRQQVNCANAVLSTIRVQGDDTAQTTRDRIDEVVVEVAEQGVRR